MATISDSYGQPRSAQVQAIVSNLLNNPTFKKDIHTTFEVNTFPTYVRVVIHMLKDLGRSCSSIAIYSNTPYNFLDKDLSTLVVVIRGRLLKFMKIPFYIPLTYEHHSACATFFHMVQMNMGHSFHDFQASLPMIYAGITQMPVTIPSTFFPIQSSTAQQPSPTAGTDENTACTTFIYTMERPN